MALLDSICITRIDSKGRGRATAGKHQIICQDGLPGDVVTVRASRQRKGRRFGTVLKRFEERYHRIQPFCAHYADCGGCTLQDITYADQLDIKTQIVEAAFRESGFVFSGDQINPVGGAASTGSDVPGPATPGDSAATGTEATSAEATSTEATSTEATSTEATNTDTANVLPVLPDLDPILPSPREQMYRNRLDFSFGSDRWLTSQEVESGAEITDRRALGFHVRKRYDRILDIEHCYLQESPSNEIRNALRDFAVENDLQFYDTEHHLGLLRSLIIRTSTIGEVMVIVVFGRDDPAGIEVTMRFLQDRFPQLASLNHTINDSKSDGIYEQPLHNVSGKAWIEEQCGSLTLRVPARAFYQTNPYQAVRLYQRVKEMIGLRATDRGPLVFDLYSGIGSISLFLADLASRVVGIETVPEAVEAAYANAELNGISNVQFLTGSVEDVIEKAVEQFGRPDLIVADPPRAGMHPKAIEAIRLAAPKRVLYVSCNPKTQAQNLVALNDMYEAVALMPVDMFPHTKHVENIACLDLR